MERDFDMESIVERVEGARRGVSTSKFPRNKIPYFLYLAKVSLVRLQL